jgi:hypothetical protein
MKDVGMGSEELLLEAGKSGELTAVLHTLSETDVDGEPKFSPMVCREIGKYIVCRTYATPMLELCHLIVVASELSRQPGRYESFFWDSGVARTSVFHSYCDYAFKDYDASLLAVSSSGVTLNYEDGPFSVQFSRMPVLSALFEFILTALGYTDIDENLQNLLGNALNKKSVSECANSLSRLIYGYLREHLPTAQSQRKFRKILAFCQDDVEGVDDSVILDFWQDASMNSEKGVDFKTFDSVLLTFVRAIQAVEAARDLSALNYAASIGGDREAGEIDPNTLSETLNSVDETIAPLFKLTSAPLNLVKFLNKQECAALETLLHAGELALRLPLSILRSNVFAKPQARLTQALRRKANGEEFQDIIHEGPEDTYQDRQTQYKHLRQHLVRSVYASLHALLQARSKNVISIILKLNPHMDFSPLAPFLIDEGNDDTVVPLHHVSIADRFIELMHDPKTVGVELATMMQAAENAYGGIQRKGFKEKEISDPDLIQAFHEGADVLLDISHDIEAFLERLENVHLAGGGWQSQFSYDLTIFNAQFSKIYGDEA